MKKKAPKKNIKAPKAKAIEAEMKYHLIEKYRELIAKKYDYNIIKNHPDIPASITADVVNSLKEYFLENLYPEPKKREKLDSAFSELQNYVMHPAKVWDLLGNLTSAIFKFGMQFPVALRAGLISLEAYTSTKHFENTLLKAALENGYTIPLSDEQFYECITFIPRREIDRFIKEVGHLFKSFTNTVLLEKTISILQDVLNRMKKKNDLYTPNEIEAIELGLSIMQKGHDLFMNYDDQIKEDILRFITTNETEFIDGLFGGK